MQKISLLVLLVSFVAGCDLAKGPRNQYNYFIKVQNQSSFSIKASLASSERSPADECTHRDVTSNVELVAGENKELAVSVKCHSEPSSSANIVYPDDANIEKKIFYFSSNVNILCDDDACVVQ